MRTTPYVCTFCDQYGCASKLWIVSSLAYEHCRAYDVPAESVGYPARSVGGTHVPSASAKYCPYTPLSTAIASVHYGCYGQQQHREFRFSVHFNIESS